MHTMNQEAMSTSARLAEMLQKNKAESAAEPEDFLDHLPLPDAVELARELTIEHNIIGFRLEKLKDRIKAAALELGPEAVDDKGRIPIEGKTCRALVGSGSRMKFLERGNSGLVSRTFAYYGEKAFDLLGITHSQGRLKAIQDLRPSTKAQLEIKNNLIAASQATPYATVGFDPPAKPARTAGSKKKTRSKK